MSRYIIILFITVAFQGLTTTTVAQSPKNTEAEFTVDGVCKMCKARIENAAYIKGVKRVEWSKESQTIKVVYNPGKTSLDNIHQSIANSGHNTNEIKADSAAYVKLPECCKYMDGVQVH